MPRDILGEYGPESRHPQAARATSGGPTSAKPLPYDPPRGPTNVGDPKGPGLHGVNHGNCGTQGPKPGAEHDTGNPGIGPVSHGNEGSQR